MFRLAQALKGHREAGSLNQQINLFGFVDDHTFLTKSGDVGVVLAVKGVDSECLRRTGESGGHSDGAKTSGEGREEGAPHASGLHA